MIALWLIHAQHFAAGRRIRDIGIDRRGLPFCDDALMIESRRLRNGEIGRARNGLACVGIELPVAGAGRIVVARVECEAEQAALTGARDEAGREIEEWRRERSVILDDADQAVLLVDEKTAVADRSQVVRRIQAAGDLL